MHKKFLACVIFATPIIAQAAGFALIEQSGSGMGNAFAGAAAIAEDASTIYFNPAGMTYLPDNQLVVALHAIKPSANFNNSGSHRSALLGGLPTPGGEGGDAGDLAFVPNMFFAKSLNENVKLGLGISAPFGLKTEYDKDWVGRYQAIKSDLKTININPSFAFKVNDGVSLGFGISAMRIDAELTNAIDTGTVCLSVPGNCGLATPSPQRRDSFVKVKGDDWSYGWNAGAIFQITEATRLGLSYRSQIHQNLRGDVDFSNLPAVFSAIPALRAQFGNGSISAKVTLPDSASASVAHNLNNEWQLLGDLTWTNWSKFENLTIVRTSGALAGQTLNSVPEKWDDTIRASVGASYKYSDALKLRAGFAYDESPVSKKYRTPRIPDNDRFWLSFGGNYKFSDTSSLDVGYTHIFVNDSSINKVTDTSTAALRDTVKGNYDNQVNILSVQFTHNF